MNDRNEQTYQTPKKVVIIDDKDIIRNALGRMISSMGNYQLHFAENGEEGVRVIKEVNPDWVITDLSMPIQNGIYVIRETKAYDPHIPVILSTGQAHDDPMVEEAVEAKPSAVLQKPFLPKDLEEVVKEFVIG